MTFHPWNLLSGFHRRERQVMGFMQGTRAAINKLSKVAIGVEGISVRKGKTTSLKA